MNVELEAGDGVKDEYLVNATIKLTGLPTKANFNLLTGSIQDITNVQDILLPAYEESEGNGASGRILPVSYTHLDVYKRQRCILPAIEKCAVRL